MTQTLQVTLRSDDTETLQVTLRSHDTEHRTQTYVGLSLIPCI